MFSESAPFTGVHPHRVARCHRDHRDPGALLLPAVQQVREAARKSQCQDHLHNLAVALADYEVTIGVYPPGRQSCDGACDTAALGKNGESAFLQLLPFIEQKPLYEQFSDTDQVWGPTTTWMATNLEPLKARPEVYVCPSDVSEPVVSITSGSTTSDVATASYAFVSGSNGPAQGIGLNVKTDNNGPFVYRNAFEQRDMLDGTSNTIYVGEVIAAHTPESRNLWSNAGRHLDSLRSTQNPINTQPGQGITYNSGGTLLNSAFASQHPGGAQFAFGDGRCTLIGENVAFQIYRGLSTRRGGESVSYQ
ncbi:MAG: DUF1559 domain-containing protein [Planctomycetaceae bacterium]